MLKHVLEHVGGRQIPGKMIGIVARQFVSHYKLLGDSVTNFRV